MSPGTTVRLTVLQKGQEKTISVTLGELPNEREARATPETREQGSGLALPRLGLTLAPASEVAGSGSDGVVVTQVEPDGVAAEHGFKAGDVILEVAGRKVASPADIRASIGNAQREGKRTGLIRVKSGEGTKFVPLRLGRAGTEWGVLPASVAPAGGTNQGDGRVSARPHRYLLPASVAPAGRGLLRGGGAHPRRPS